MPPSTMHPDTRRFRRLTPSGPVSVGIFVAGFILLLIAWHMAHVQTPPPVSRRPLPPGSLLNPEPPAKPPFERT